MKASTIKTMEYLCTGKCVKIDGRDCYLSKTGEFEIGIKSKGSNIHIQVLLIYDDFIKMLEKISEEKIIYQQTQ